jgi:predicted kinase
MNKPLLLIITGSPASGKTTLAHILAERLQCPLISRDSIKAGLVRTVAAHSAELGRSADWQVYETFFAAIALHLTNHISVMAEAAFQDTLWKHKLNELADKARIKIIICQTHPDILKQRFTERVTRNPDRETYHGDRSLMQSEERFAALFDPYQAVQMQVPTLVVDTTDSYSPSIETLIRFIDTN